jgi:hypothetical protein
MVASCLLRSNRPTLPPETQNGATWIGSVLFLSRVFKEQTSIYRVEMVETGCSVECLSLACVSASAIIPVSGGREEGNKIIPCSI